MGRQIRFLPLDLIKGITTVPYLFNFTKSIKEFLPLDLIKGITTINVINECQGIVKNFYLWT